MSHTTIADERKLNYRLSLLPACLLAAVFVVIVSPTRRGTYAQNRSLVMQQYSELQRPDNTQFYTRIASTWPRGPFVKLRIGDYPEIFRIPQAFLEGCDGNNTLRFVEELAQLCVQEPGHLSNLEQLDLQIDQIPPTDHVLTFTADAPGNILTWSAGPDGRYHNRAPAPDEPFDDTASLRPSEVSNLQVGVENEPMAVRKPH